jgi:transposase
MVRKDQPASQPQTHPGGRPPALKPEHIAALREIVAERAQASLDEIADELHRRCDVRVCAATIRRALRAEGVVRLKPTRRVFATADKAPKRYGYTAAHRREDAPLYSTDLTDAEWELVADLFERVPGQRGTPVHYSRRELVNACSYVLRTGCAWRLLPTTFPPWQAVYKTFVRWVAAGVFERMQDRLRQQWRSRMGRTSEPTAVVIDAQSTRSSPQGGESGFDAGKKVKGRKRNLVVDTLGLVIAVTVTAASVQDRDAATAVVAQACATTARDRKALYRRCVRRKVCSRHRGPAPYPCRSRTASRERHDGNLAQRRARDGASCRNQRGVCGPAKALGR